MLSQKFRHPCLRHGEVHGAKAFPNFFAVAECPAHNIARTHGARNFVRESFAMFSSVCVVSQSQPEKSQSAKFDSLIIN
jgi:hypothetical protein